MDKELVYKVLIDKLLTNDSDREFLVPAIKSLADTGSTSLSDMDLLEILIAEDSVELKKLADHLQDKLRSAALEYYQLKKTLAEPSVEASGYLRGLPLKYSPGFRINKSVLLNLKDLLLLAADSHFLNTRKQSFSNLKATLKNKFKKTNQELKPQQISYFFSGKTLKALESKRYAVSMNPGLFDAAVDSVSKALSKKKSMINDTVMNGNWFNNDADPDQLFDALLQGFNDPDERGKQALLDEMCAVAELSRFDKLEELVKTPWQQIRASLIFSLRFGVPDQKNWGDWLDWSRPLKSDFLRKRDELISDYLQKWPTVYLLILNSKIDMLPQHQSELIKDMADKQAETIRVEEFIRRWGHILSKEELNLLREGEEKVKEIPDSKPAAAAFKDESKKNRLEPESASRPIPIKTPQLPKEKVVKVPVKPPEPTIWDKHIFPFMSDNWAVLTGIMMTVIGGSTLAYLKWDHHWLWRYTIIPLMLGSLTTGLSGLAGWLEKRGRDLETTGAILRGAAVALLPINFMTVALLSHDSDISFGSRSILVPIISLVYIIWAGWGLRKWCLAVSDKIGNVLGVTLLLINCLVMLGPIASALGNVDRESLNRIVGTGFYLGFFLVGGVVIYFTHKVLTKELIKEKRLLAFFGLTLSVSYIQVFIWVHGFLKVLPHVYTYAPMIILSGLLLFVVEKRFLEFNEESKTHSAESFLGFALVLLGVLMGFVEPVCRIFVLLLAGVVWLFQSLSRKHPLHYWISLTFLSMAGAAIGMLEFFPREMLPLLGIGVSGAMSLGVLVSQRYKNEALQRATCGMQHALFFLTAFVTVLCQWHFLTPPCFSACVLLVLVAGFFWRAFRDNRLRWVHVAMMMLALTLPYLGCVDMMGKTLYGNKMVFGLAVISILWLLLSNFVKHPLIRNARSTVLVSYGAIAVAAMILRVLFERDLPSDILNKTIDYSGPLMITVCLLFATYFTRSLIPAVFAYIVVIILFPELKAGFKETFEMIGWGSGLGSACSSLAVLAGCFSLRSAPCLKDLKDGDLLMGKFLFPIRRYDHTLFTWPLIAAASFLVLKTESLTFLRNIINHTVFFKVSMAIFISGLCWMTLAVYYRRFQFMRVAVCIGWFWLFAGILCGYLHFSSNPHWSRPVLITMLLMQGVYFTFRIYLQNILRWTEELFQKPTYHLLCFFSPLVALIICCSLCFGALPKDMAFLMFFIVLQLIWHELRCKCYVFSSFLFFLIFNTILAVSCPGDQWLIERLSFLNYLLPIVLYFFFIQVVQLFLEHYEEGYQKLKSLIIPFVSGSGVLLIMIGLATLVLSISREHFTTRQLIFIFTSLLLLARGQRSLLVYALVVFNAYSYLHLRMTIQPVAVTSAKVQLLFEPWRMGLLAMFFALSGIFGKFLRNKFEAVVAGVKPLPFFKTPQIGFIYVPAVAVSIVCVLVHVIDGDFRGDQIQLAGSYLAALAMFLIAWDWRKPFLFVLSTIALILANIHLVRVFAGDWLISVGLSQIHLICLGFVLTLIEGAVTKRIKSDKFVVRYMNRLCLSMGVLILCLLAMNYSIKHNLAAISYHRFILSGFMALLAGLSFRRAARVPDEEEVKHVELFEAAYHVGVTVAIWCWVLLIPWFRTPATALLALGLPMLYFYFKTEYSHHAFPGLLNRFRHTTAALCFLILVLYIFRTVFQIMLFPEESVHFVYYHYNSFYIVIVALVLLRLHGLGGGFWQAFYGGLFLMIGTFFALTFFPEMSPDGNPYNSAFCAVLLGHFFTALSYERSPLRTFIQWMADINDDFWHILRKDWGICQLILTHVAVGWALINYGENSYLLAPLIFLTSTLVLHHGIIKKSPAYLGIAGLELLISLHMDFLVPSYLPQYFVVWVLLGIWGAALISLLIFDKTRKLNIYGYLGAGCAVLVMAHIIFHHLPWSTTGLWCFAIMVALISLTPRMQKKVDSLGEYLAVYTLLIAPLWLVFFIYQTCVVLNGKLVFSNTGFALSAITVALTGSGCLLFKQFLLKKYLEAAIYPPFVYDQFLTFAGKWGGILFSSALYIAFIMTVLTQVCHYMDPFSQTDLVLVCILYAGLTVAWYFDGQRTRTMPPYYLLQLCFLGCFAVIRRQLMLTTDFWNYEYDVWAALLGSFILVGVKQFVDLKPKEVRVPVLTSICLLPVIALVWVMVHQLGTNTALIVVGLQSLLFTYIGKDDRESPYHIFAIAGFVAFVIMLFWTKLELRVVHVYVIPVGTGILVLLQLFKERIKPETRNQVRFTTLMVMLGTAGYYALVNSDAPTAYIIIFCVLCLASMGVGSFLRVRLYLYLGFFGLLVDLLAIFYRVFLHLESGRMTLVGCLVLVTGLIFVGGAVYYKTNQDRMNQFINHWRHKLGEWE